MQFAVISFYQCKSVAAIAVAVRSSNPRPSAFIGGSKAVRCWRFLAALAPLLEGDQRRKNAMEPVFITSHSEKSRDSI